MDVIRYFRFYFWGFLVVLLVLVLAVVVLYKMRPTSDSESNRYLWADYHAKIKVLKKCLTAVVPMFLLVLMLPFSFHVFRHFPLSREAVFAQMEREERLVLHYSEENRLLIFVTQGERRTYRVDIFNRSPMVPRFNRLPPLYHDNQSRIIAPGKRYYFLVVVDGAAIYTEKDVSPDGRSRPIRRLRTPFNEFSFTLVMLTSGLNLFIVLPARQKTGTRMD